MLPFRLQCITSLNYVNILWDLSSFSLCPGKHSTFDGCWCHFWDVQPEMRRDYFVKYQPCFLSSCFFFFDRKPIIKSNILRHCAVLFCFVLLPCTQFHSFIYSLIKTLPWSGFWRKLGSGLNCFILSRWALCLQPAGDWPPANGKNQLFWCLSASVCHK